MSRPGGRVRTTEPSGPDASSIGTSTPPSDATSTSPDLPAGHVAVRPGAALAVEPDDHPLRVHRLAGGSRDGRQQLVGRGAAADPCAEVGERVVRRGPVPVRQAVGDPEDPASQRLERQRHDHRGQQRPPEPASGRVLHGATQQHDQADVTDGDERRGDREDHGPADDDLDLVEPVAQHRHRDADDEEHVRHVERHARPPRLPAVVEALPDDQDEERERRRRRRRA